MAAETHTIQVLACGIFKRELEELIKTGQLSLPVAFTDSMLHMMPALLEYELQQNLAAQKTEHDQTILIYGDCQPRMVEMTNQPNVCRVEGMNCCEIILGQDLYHSLRSEGVFFLLPEWTERWEEVFKTHLGFSEHTAKSFMGEMHSKLLYLDTGIVPVPEKALQAAADFCDLPYEIMKVDLQELLKATRKAIAGLQELE